MIEVLENSVVEKIPDKVVGEKYDDVSKTVSMGDRGYRNTEWENVCPKCESNSNVILVGGSDMGGESVCRSCNNRWLWSGDGTYSYI